VHQFDITPIAASSNFDFLITPESNPLFDSSVEPQLGWNDTFTARRRVFANGCAEITVTQDKFFVGRSGSVGCGSPSKAVRGESKNKEMSERVNGQRARKNVRLLCKEISADRMVTLTYRENVTDRARAISDWKKFCRAMGKNKAFHYVAVMEEQERGSIHFHVAVHGRQSYHLLRSIWSGIVGTGPDGQSMCYVHVREPSKFGFGKNGGHKLASYISKYCGKSMSVRSLNEKRYFRSYGIVLPVLESWRLPSTTMLHAVQTAFLIASEYGLSGSQYWVDNGLRCCWIATAPGSADSNFIPF
jgi:hypothetical protein